MVISRWCVVVNVGLEFAEFGSSPKDRKETMGFWSTLFGSKNRCSVCGSAFSNTAAKSTDLMGMVMGKRGLVCGKCARLYCMKCAPKDSQGTVMCNCGSNLIPRM
jgi:hypothetical protein